MAKSPDKKSAKLVIYPKQWPDTRVDKPEIDRGESSTQPMGFERNRTGKKFSEETAMDEQLVPGRPPGARETFLDRWKKGRARHIPHPAPIPGGHYKSRHQEERPHYEETEAMTSKTYTEFVTEAAKRGRPRKLRPGEEADTLHIQDQLNKLTHPNHVEVHFKDGSKHRIPREHANMALHHLNSLKPIDRADHAEHMAKSHGDFYHVLSKKSIPAKKKGISLAGPKLRKEEVEQVDELKKETLQSYMKGASKTTNKYHNNPGWYTDARADRMKDSTLRKLNNRLEGETMAHNKITGNKGAKIKATEETDHDDGWYAHKEMHGSKAISKEDWKKGVRPKKSVKKEDVDLDESLKDARKHRAAALKVGIKHPDFNKHMSAMHDAMAAHASKSNLDGGKLADEHKSSAKHYAKEEIEQVDELKMSHGAYVSAMKRTTGHDAGSEEGRVDAKKLVARAKKYKGAKFAKDLEGAHGMAERPHRNKTMGQIASDKLAWRSPSKATASGTANKNLLKSLKGSLTKGDYRKPSLPKRKLPEEVEQIDEWGQSKKAITGPHAKTSTMAITPPKVGYKGKQKKPKVQELTREEAAPKTSFKKMKTSLMSKANREKDASN